MYMSLGSLALRSSRNGTKLSLRLSARKSLSTGAAETLRDTHIAALTRFKFRICSSF